MHWKEETVGFLEITLLLKNDQGKVVQMWNPHGNPGHSYVEHTKGTQNGFFGTKLKIYNYIMLITITRLRDFLSN